MPRPARRVLIAIGLLHTIAAVAPATDNPNKKSIDSTKPNVRTNLRRLVSGPTQTLQTALAGSIYPTAEVLLTPVANTPTGPYGHGGYYSDADITGQRLKVSSGGGRTFWNMRIRNWGPERLRGYEGRIDASSLRGHIADCGGGPGSCQGAANLLPASQSCTTTPDCIAAAGESAPICRSGLCDYAWVSTNRNDWAFASSFSFQVGCGVSDPAGANCFAALENTSDSLVDDGQAPYAATFAIDVPAGARGVYKLQWREPNISTILIDGNSPSSDITIAAAVPGELEIARGACCYDLGTGACTPNLFQEDCLQHPTTNDVVWSQDQQCDPLPCVNCKQDSDCDDDDECTIQTCDTYCRFQPIPQWNPENMCCDPLTGGVEDLPAPGPCFETYCAEDGTAVVLQLPEGEQCDPNDPCLTSATCNNIGQCIGTLDTGTSCPKPRYITFNPIQTAAPSAIQVTIVSLHKPTPQYRIASNFSAFVGRQRWVGEPFDCPNSIGHGTSSKCATLTCDPVIFDFAAALQGEPLNITGDAIIPSSVYSVSQFVDTDLPPVHITLAIKTSRWGDVAAPFQDPLASTRTQPNVTDLAFVIDRANDRFLSLDKIRVQLRGNNPDPNAAVGIVDMALAFDAINGIPYPYAGPSPCP